MSDDREEDEAIEAIEVRRNPWLLGLAMAPLALPITLLLSGAPVYSVCALPLATLFGIATPFVTWRRNPLPQRVPVRIRADRSNMEIEDAANGRTRSVSTRSMMRGVRTAGSGPTVFVRITRRFATTLHFETAATLEPALLTRLGLDVRQTTASFRGMSRLHATRRRMGIAVSIAAMVSVAIALGGMELTPWALALVPPVLLTPLILALVPSRIEVGADGVLVRWAGSRHYVRHADIVATATVPMDPRRRDVDLLVIDTRDGAGIAIPMARHGGWYDDADALSARLLDARRAWQGGLVGTPVPLLRGARTHASFVAALRKQEAADLRSTAVPRAELWRVVEDVSAAPFDRAAAALSLGRTLSEADRQRLELTAKATVTPKLRVVLERAETAEDDEVIVHLKALERTRS